jgi:hypothetical protein
MSASVAIRSVLAKLEAISGYRMAMLTMEMCPALPEPREQGAEEDVVE